MSTPSRRAAVEGRGRAGAPRRAAALLIGLSLSCAHPVRAAPTYQVLPLTPVADTFVQSNTATTNYGGNTTLEVRSHATGERRAAYRFSFATVPAGSRLVSATLKLWATATLGNAVGVFKVGAGAAGWTEFGATWTNTSGMSPEGTALYTFTPSTTGQHSGAITSLVSQWLAGTTANNGVLVQLTGAPSNVSAAFTSKEWGTVAQRPVLELTLLPAPVLDGAAVTTVISDPHRGTTNPKRIPGAVLSTVWTVSSANSGYPDANTVVFAVPLSTGASLYVGDLGTAGSGPVAFANGTPSSTLSFTYSGLASATDDLAFSNDGGVSYAYVPTADASGYDAAITHIRFNPKGTFAGEDGMGAPKFTLTWRTKVK